MLYIQNNSVDPYFNLALEEFFLERPDFNATDALDDSNRGAPNNLTFEPILLLWQNAPTVVVGGRQNTLEEINLAFVEERKINVVRRTTGGGAVYHDLGNLNYTFIVPDATRLATSVNRRTLSSENVSISKLRPKNDATPTTPRNDRDYTKRDARLQANCARKKIFFLLSPLIRFDFTR